MKTVTVTHRSHTFHAFRILRSCLPALLLWAGAQPLLAADYSGALVGSVTGQVENQDGQFVQPRATVEAVTEVVINGPNITAIVNGTASCTEGLGLQITFRAEYDNATGALTGFYSDIPNSANLDKPITFVKGSGFAWTAQISGEAPSATGLREYDLALDVMLPGPALFPGTAFPPERSLSGQLADTRTISVPIEIPALNVSTTLQLGVEVAGQWQAKVVPLGAGQQRITGNVVGSISTPTPATLSLNIPNLGEQQVQIAVTGGFGGSLITNSATELAFIGSWSASVGNGNYGGDLEILVPLQNINSLDSLPYAINGVFQVTPDFPGALPVSVPVDIAGGFPFSL